MDRIELTHDDILYVADLLRAISWAQEELGRVSTESMAELESGLNIAEAALRRAAAEMSKQ